MREEIMMERGLSVDHTTIYRWVIAYAPEIEKRSRKHLKSTNYSMRVDETYVKVNGKWKYLDRALDSDGNTLDFLLSAKRDKKAAKRFLLRPYAEETSARAVRFLKKVLKARHNKQPRVINLDENPAYPPAIEELKEEEILSNECELRRARLPNLLRQLVSPAQEKYLNNIIEQDHRFPKKLAKYKSYFQYFHTAWRTRSRI